MDDNENSLLEIQEYYQKQAAAKPFQYDDEDDEDVDGGVDTILATTEKVLAVNKGLTPADQRDSLRYRKIYSMDRLLNERIALDTDQILRNTMRKVSRVGSLKPISSGHFSGYTEGMVVGHPLSLPLEEINPMHLLEQSRRVTQMGPGGLPGSSSITEEAQNLHPSEFFFLSAVEGPECFLTGQVMTDTGWVDWKDVTKDTMFWCKVKGKTEYNKASRITADPYDGQVIIVDTPTINMVVTPNHRIYYIDDVGVLRWKYARNLFGLELVIPLKSDYTHKLEERHWSLGMRKGTAYCATVPGGMLHVRGNTGSSGYWSGNSERIGVDTRVAWGSKLGSDGRIYQRFRNKRTGKYEWLNSRDLENKVIGLPD
jgi:hypothetical protein